MSSQLQSSHYTKHNSLETLESIRPSSPLLASRAWRLSVRIIHFHSPESEFEWIPDADPYIPGGNGAQYYQNQNNFFRIVRNFVIDLRLMPATSSATGLHWQMSQSTALTNVVVHMSQDSATNHQGIFMENGR